MISRNQYDIIVVGAGPAGSTAARFAAKHGAKVLLLEKDRDIGVPVRCAEGVGALGLLKVVDAIDPRWIATTITGFRLVAPDGTAVESKWGDKGYCLERKIFDNDLALLAAQNGVEVVTKAYVYDLIKNAKGIQGVRVRHQDKDIEIEGHIVIGADGVESRVGRWAGVHTFTKMEDMETCVQYTLSNLDVPQDTCEFIFSTEKAPGGYIWVFPKGNGKANVGIGIAGTYSKIKSPQQYLNEYIAERFPEKPVLSTTCGGVPCAVTLKQIAGDGFMLVGDAAHQANPISGGGIVSGMVAGKMAGIIAAEAAREKDYSRKRLSEYETNWNKTIGKDYHRFYKIKEFVDRFSDEKMNRLAHELCKVPKDDLTMMKIFKTALKTNPKLLFEVIKLFK